MRSITIKRPPAFTGSSLKARVYIYDEEAPEIHINHRPYRRLGILKNGEEQTFWVSDGNVELLVVSDPIMKGIYNDRICIAAGAESVVLSLGCENGLGLCFDGLTDEHTMKRRKKKKQLGIVATMLYAIAILLILVLIGLAMGLVGSLVDGVGTL